MRESQRQKPYESADASVDPVVVAEYCARRDVAELLPHARLSIRLLTDAVNDLIKLSNKRPHPQTDKVRAELVEWFTSEDRSWLFGFATICESFSIDVDYVRRKLSANDWRPALRRVYTERAAMPTKCEHRRRYQGVPVPSVYAPLYVNDTPPARTGTEDT